MKRDTLSERLESLRREKAEKILRNKEDAKEYRRLLVSILRKKLVKYHHVPNFCRQWRSGMKSSSQRGLLVAPSLQQSCKK